MSHATLARGTVHCISFALLAAAAVGCAGKRPPSAAFVEQTKCKLHFANVDRPEERERVYKIVRSYAVSDTLTPKDVPTTPTFDLEFYVTRLAVLDEIHPQVLFSTAGGTTADPVRQVFNPRDPQFAINYDTINIGATIEVIVNFTVTPGAKLFYKPQGGGEKDITKEVGPAGKVALRTTIAKGQEFLFARSVSGNVSRYVKINVFTQQVQEIQQAEYP